MRLKKEQKMYNEADYFEALNGRKFEYRGMESPTIMKVWEYLRGDPGAHQGRFGGIDVHDLDIDTLKLLKVWDNLTEDVQKDITGGLSQKTQAVQDHMESMRSGRRKKYVGVPKEIECITCHSKVVVVPSVLVHKVEKIREEKGLSTYSVEDYIGSFVCNKCVPVKRGKKPNPEFANIPKKMKCKCGKEVVVNIYQLKAKAEKMGTTIQKLIEGFVCQSCAPTKHRGRQKKT